MAALTTALEIPQEKFIILNSADVLLGGVHLFFFLLFGIRWVGKILPQYEFQRDQARVEKGEPSGSVFTISRPFFKLSALSSLILAMTLTLSFLFFGEIVPVVVVVGVSTFGILFSLNKNIRELKGSFDIGIYYILVFSLAAGSMTDIAALFTFQYLAYFWLYAFMITIATVLHLCLCWLCKIDRDTAIITSFAGICGPPFVGVLATAMNNKEIVVAGVSCGLVGYAVGNYFGIIVYYILAP